MTTRVIFCVSYDPLNVIKSPTKLILFLQENALLTRTMSMTLRLRAKVLLHVCLYDFYDMALSTDSNMTLTFSPLSV